MAKLTNYIAFVHPETGAEQIGHLDQQNSTIQPLSFGSGTPVDNLYQVIEAGPGDNITAAGSPLATGSVKILPVISGRDVLAVGKNYMEHAKEFNSSGFDSSDKVDRPSHPVIFTKRATSIIADGEEILLHDGFTSTVDYEGEIGVIISKPGFRVSAQNAWDYVWGYTIINDVTARERQRDHKQFYIGKSPDSFCPMGPIAVPKKDLPKILKIQTHVNGELRQDSSTEDLIFSIPELIETLSAGQTLQPGDVLATGTPAGVGIGKNPPVYLKPGDEVAISVTGLGTLTNKVAQPGAINTTGERISAASSFTLINSDKAVGRGDSLTIIDGKPISYNKLGSGAENIIFVHGLGGTKDYWTPLVSTLALSDRATLHLYDFEGHGQTPTHPLNPLTVSSLANDLAGIFKAAGASPTAPVTLVAHSFGCHIALKFTLDNPGLVKKLILIGPPPSPLPDAGAQASLARAALVRTRGMAAAVDAVVAAGTSDASKRKSPIATAAVRMALLGQNPEAYAKACHALASSSTTTLSVEGVTAPTLIITGADDKVSPPAVCEQYHARINASRLVVLPEVGHWHVLEDVNGVSNAVNEFLAAGRDKACGVTIIDRHAKVVSLRYLHLQVSNPVPLTIVKGAGHEFIPLPNGENATVADFHSIRTKTTDSPTYFTSGFYKITAGPARPANYTFEETKYVLSGQIDILDEATGITHHLVPGDFAFFHVGSKVKFSTKSNGFAFYAVTRPVKTPHPNLQGRDEGTKSRL